MLWNTVNRRLTEARDFLKKLRNQDAETKQKWMFACASVAIIIIVGLWMAYLSATVPDSYLATGGEGERRAAQNNEEGRSFLQTIYSGFQVLPSQAESFIESLEAEASKTKDIEINPPN